MSRELKNIERIVAKIDNEVIGNAFLVDSKHAITVKHCVTTEKITLVFPKLYDQNVVEVGAIVNANVNLEEDEFIILDLDRELEGLISDYIFEAKQISLMEKAFVYGYDKNFLVEGKWTELVHSGSQINNALLVQDMLFDVTNSREYDFSGLSGSPIVCGNSIIGIVSQETTEKGKAVGIHGISIKSQVDFFRNNNISFVEELNESDYTFEMNMSIGGYRNKNNNITLGAVQEIQSKFKGVYREKLSNIIEQHQRGDVNGAWDNLKKEIIELDKMALIDDEIKAEYHYRMAIWYIEDRNDISKAQKRYDKAKELNIELDGCIFEALKLSQNGECLNAEDILEPIDSVNKYNVFIQICINSGKIEKAYKKYEEMDQIIDMNNTSYYLMSILHILRREYDKAMECIDSAIEKDKKIPFYHLIKGIIWYWKAIPKDVCLADDLYPVMFVNGLFYQNEKQRSYIIKSIDCYNKGYQLAENVENTQQMEFILSIWVNTLSINNVFQQESVKPLELLKNIDKFNISALLYMLQKNILKDDDISIDDMEKRLNNEKNKIGHIIVIVELCLYRNDKKNAKEYLHKYKSIFWSAKYYEYWYEYIVKVENDSKRLKETEKEIQQNNVLDEVRKNRLLAMFMQLDYERDSELESLLVDIYGRTGNRLDILNLIFFYKSRRKWTSMLEYSDELSQKFSDGCGNIYKAQALIELEKYDDALKIIDSIEENNVFGIEMEILQYRLIIYERLGDYVNALAIGNKLLERKKSLGLYMRLSHIYILDGNETEALNILLEAEKADFISVELYQKISVCYLASNLNMAWKYAEKAVKMSENKPEIMLWATNIANRTGKSSKAEEYLHNIMVSNNTHNLLTIKNIDEILEMFRSSREEAEEKVKMLWNAQLVSHLFVDSYGGNHTYGEYFYEQWKKGEMLPMEFGGHYFQKDNMLEKVNKIAIDYSTCLLLFEMNLLVTLCDYIEQVYIPGDLFEVISNEIRTIPVNQPELISSKYEVIKRCDEELKVKFVELEMPVDINEIGVEKRADIIFMNTAQVNNAEWVSCSNGEGINEYEIVYALHRTGKISQDTFDGYETNENMVREANVEYILNNELRLLVDDIVLMKWDKAFLLPVICENYEVIATTNIKENVKQEYNKMIEKQEICERLRSLKELLLSLKEKRKVSFLPIQEGKDGMVYSNMIKTILTASEKRNLPICVDDRVMTSYSGIGDIQIYSIFDLMKMLFCAKKITLEQYCSIWEAALDKKIRYVIPDENFVLYALDVSSINKENYELIESDMLTKIRKYVVQAMSENSFLSNDTLAYNRMPERESFVFSLQHSSREIIRNIWKTDKSYLDKQIFSEWVLCHYSQFAFDFGRYIDEKHRKICHSIQLADFIISGLLLAKEDKYVEEYYKWLYQWLDDYFEQNEEIKEKSFNYVKEYMESIIRETSEYRTKAESDVVKWMFATGIYYMPKEYKDIIFENDVILNIYNSIYSSISIVLSHKRRIPVEIFRAWEKQILSMEEKEILEKDFQGIRFAFSWKYIMPALPGLEISWKEGDNAAKKNIFMDMGARLKHCERKIRKKEFQYISKYLQEIDFGEQYLKLMSSGKYEEAAEEILQLLDMSEEFQNLRIKTGLINYWLDSEDTIKMMVPSNMSYFKKLYNYNASKELEGEISVTVPLILNKKFNCVNTENCSPIRLLHKLNKMLSENSKDEDVIEIIELLFSYIKEEKGKYGSLFVMFLKLIWNIFNNNEDYKNEPANLIIWTYIWVDKMMKAVIELENDNTIDATDYAEELSTELHMDIAIDDFCDNTKDADILCPQYMNLFKICIMGALIICMQYKNRMNSLAEKVLSKLNTYFLEWMLVPIYTKEAELQHKFDINKFDSDFATSFYELLDDMMTIGKCQNNSYVWDKHIIMANRTEFILESIYNAEQMEILDLVYIFMLSREQMEESTIVMVNNIISKHILEKEFRKDKIWHRILVWIGVELQEEFRREYVKHEYIRLSGLLESRQILLDEVYDIVTDIAQIYSDINEYLEFWERCLDYLNLEDSLVMAKRIGWMQRRLPYEYTEKARLLRMKLELK